MSSSDTFRRPPLRRLLRPAVRVGAAVLAAALLGGCFRPLHGVSVGGHAVQDHLASIEVATINPDNRSHTRLAYYTQSELTYRLTGGAPDDGAAKRFRLETSVTESVSSTIVNTSTGNAEAALLTGTAEFRLLPAAGGEPVFAGKAVASSAYDRTPQRFASLRAARDAQIRVAKALAEQIHTRVAARFASGAVTAGR
ncbi:MAG: LPS assembly lipoprotein LptE [Pseudochelatococcus sp.]|jgi:LPS-assembly lipoprotein|uniref:LPS assembly lipoprotein LptE n=1 Tax=Pseudochelatococcus sp. TaxID=2020869 RepID=UPI003D8A7B15